MRNSQSPSIYSIFHNALPYYLDRVDLCSIDQEGDNPAQQWVADILRGNLTVQTTASTLASEKLLHLYFESKNLEKTTGAKTLGLGYPFLIDTHESDLIVAPLFIWQVTLEPAQTKVDAWIFKFGEGHFIQPNYKIFKYLKEKYGLDLIERAEQLAMGGKMSAQSLQAFCSEVAGRLLFENNWEDGAVVPSPNIDEMGVFSEKGAVHWSGVLSLFPPQDYRQRAEIAKPEDIFMPSALAPFDEGSFDLLPPNPEQATALEMISQNKITVVGGPDGAGKSGTVINLIINALSNGQRCLVVSSRASALKHSQNLLAKSGLGQLHFLLDDALHDKAQMLELLRVAASGTGRSIPHDENDFQFKKNKLLREKTKLDVAYAAVHKKVFGDYNWTETVGLFLAANRIEGKELLASQLNSNDFDYSTKEYDHLKQGILSCQPLFYKVKTLTHPLSNLHDEVFHQKTAKESLKYVQDRLITFLDKTAQLHHRFINKTDVYAARLKEHYEHHHEYLARLSQLLKEKILGYGDSLGNDFLTAGSGGFQLPDWFSSKKKKIAHAREEVGRHFLKLVREHAQRQYFDFQFEPCKEGTNIPKTLANVEAFQAALALWQTRLEQQMQEEVMRLNSKTAHPALDTKEQITELEFSLDVLLEELNEAKLYQKPIENKTLTIPQRQKFLETIIEQLETTQLNLRDFDLFHQWQTNWLHLGPLGQKVVRALVKVKPGDWMSAFESWYFNNLLAKEQDPVLPANRGLVKNFTDAWHDLKPLVINQILNLWQERQKEAVKNLKRNNKKAWQLIFEKQGHKQAETMHLGDVIGPGFEAVSAFLPVLFVTPHVALNVLPQLEKSFDYLIFDEANRFPIEPAAAMSPLGKRMVIVGTDDAHGTETSLLQYALENDVPCVNLTNRFSDHAADLTDEEKDVAAQGFVGLVVENVEGRFHEMEGTNDVEAQHIIRLLNQIKQTPQRVFPSVGIVTLTVEQRDLIAGYLLKLKQQNAFGSDKIQQLERNGMGVFHVDELYGQQFDVLIISCALGMVNLKGVLTKKIVFLNTPEGVSHIRMLVHKPAQQRFLVHSLPDGELDKFLSKKFDEGTWLLANAIKLGEAVANGNEEKTKQSLEALGRISAQKPPKSAFATEVANALRPYIEDRRLARNVPFGDVHIPLSIKPLAAEQPPMVIHPDGFFGNNPAVAGLWESKQKEKIAKMGLVYLPVWSVSWFKNPAQEARQLAAKIIKQDAAFKEKEAPNDVVKKEGDAKS